RSPRSLLARRAPRTPAWPVGNDYLARAHLTDNGALEREILVRLARGKCGRRPDRSSDGSSSRLAVVGIDRIEPIRSRRCAGGSGGGAPRPPLAPRNPPDPLVCRPGPGFAIADRGPDDVPDLFPSRVPGSKCPFRLPDPGRAAGAAPFEVREPPRRRDRG